NHSGVIVSAERHEEAIVRYELGGVGAVHLDRAVGLGAIPIPLAAASNGGVQAHWVVGDVVASAIAVVAQQGRNRVVASVGGRQRFINSVLHHGAFGPVAVV